MRKTMMKLLVVMMMSIMMMIPAGKILCAASASLPSTTTTSYSQRRRIVGGGRQQQQQQQQQFLQQPQEPEEERQQEQQQQRQLKKEDCTDLNGIVCFEEYIYLNVVGIPALVTKEGLIEIANLFVQSYMETNTCTSSNNYGPQRIVENAEIISNAIDAYGDNYEQVMFDLGGSDTNTVGDTINFLSTISENDLVYRNYTYLMVVRGRCNACGEHVLLFANSTTTTTTSTRRRHLYNDNDEQEKKKKKMMESSNVLRRRLGRHNNKHQHGPPPTTTTIPKARRDLIELEEENSKDGGPISKVLTTSNNDVLEEQDPSSSTKINGIDSRKGALDKNEDNYTVQDDKNSNKASKDDENDDESCVCEGPYLDDFLFIYNNYLKSQTTIYDDLTIFDTSFEIISDLSIETITQLSIIENCYYDYIDTDETTTTTNLQPSFFETTLVVEIETSTLNSPNFDMKELEQSIKESYNEATLNGDSCDIYFRTIVKVEVDLLDFEFNRRRHHRQRRRQRQLLSNDLSSAKSSTSTSNQEPFQPQDDTSDSNGDYEDASTRLSKRTLQEGSDPFVFVQRDYTKVTFDLTVRCLGCNPKNQTLFDDLYPDEFILGGRRLLRTVEQELHRHSSSRDDDDDDDDDDSPHPHVRTDNMTFIPPSHYANDDDATTTTPRLLLLEDEVEYTESFDSTCLWDSYSINSTDCLCPEGTIRRGTKPEEVLEQLQTVANIPIKSVREVEPVDCGVGEVRTFQTTLVGTLTIEGDVPEGGVTALEVLVQDAYNDAAEDVCDPFFRTIIAASLQGDLVVGQDLPITFDVTVRCRNCDGVDELFMDDSFLRHRIMMVQDDRKMQDTAFCSCVAGTPLRGPTQLEFDNAFEEQVGDIIPNISPPTDPPSSPPTSIPSSVPSELPSSFPSEFPSTHPSTFPSFQPSSLPSSSINPSSPPSLSSVPSTTPSTEPSVLPSTTPSTLPSALPSTAPSTLPSTLPSTAPSTLPSTLPSTAPSTLPSALPSTTPSSLPSALPSTVPSSLPSAMPSTTPSSLPSALPSTTPSVLPSALPSVEPTPPM